MASVFKTLRKRYFPTVAELQAESEARIQALPVGEEVKRRVRMTVGCRDADPIQKVRDAGQIHDTPAGRVQVMHNGVKVVAGGYHGDWMAEIIHQLRGHHEPQEEWAFHCILRHIPPGGTMLELGSFWAYFSLWFATAVPQARLIIVEPDPNNLEVGLRNLRLNGKTAVAIQASLGADALPPKPFRCESDGLARDIPELSVDAIRAEHGLRKLDLVLADIQGAELSALHGLARTVRDGAIRFMVISTHHHTISGSRTTHTDCLNWIREHGGTVFAEHAVEEGYSGDGVIVASFDPLDRHLPKIALSRNTPEQSLFGGT